MKKQLFLNILFLAFSFLGTTLCVKENKGPEKKTSEEEAHDFFKGPFSKPVNPIDEIEKLDEAWVDPSEAAFLGIDIIEADADSEDERKIERLIDVVEVKNALDEQEEKKNVLKQIKSQNTLLASYGPIGIYKRDLLEGGFLAADFLADIKLRNFLTQRRIEFITNKLLTEPDELVAMINRVNESHARYEERSEINPSIGKAFINKPKALDALLNPLRRYVEEHHALAAGYVPFNRRTIIPLLARWGWEKISAALKNRLILQPEYMGEENRELLFNDQKMFNERNRAFLSAFDETPDGKLVSRPITESPLSLCTYIKIFMYAANPVQGIQKFLFSSTDNPWLGRWKFLSEKMGLKLPEFLFSDNTRLALEFLGIGYSLNYFDYNKSKQWEEYVIKNRELLLKKILTYKRLITKASSDEKELVAARDDLRTFVEKGHESTSWIPGSDITSWWEARDSGRNMITRWLGLGAVVLVATQFGRWWYGTNEN